MIKNIVDQIMKNGGYPESARGGLTDYVKSIFYKGCIGFTSLQVANPTRVVDKNGKLLGTLPNVENCYASFAEAQKVQKEWDKAGKCACDENHTTIPGGKGKARIFAVQYSSEGVNPKPDSIRRYNLTTDPNVLISIWTPADPDKIPFDFFFFSQPGDPWYNAALPWIHANEGGSKMVIKAADDKGLKDQLANNKQKFDKMFYCVACEKQWNKAQG